MGITNIPPVIGNGIQAASEAKIINEILAVINFSGNRKPNATLYLGHKQRYALRRLEGGSLGEVINDNFFRWPIIWVQKESHVHLAV